MGNPCKNRRIPQEAAGIVAEAVAEADSAVCVAEAAVAEAVCRSVVSADSAVSAVLSRIGGSVGVGATLSRRRATRSSVYVSLTSTRQRASGPKRGALYGARGMARFLRMLSRFLLREATKKATKQATTTAPTKKKKKTFILKGQKKSVKK